MPAFTYRLSADTALQVEELVPFDVELTNQGGHYQTDNSIFICPYDGVYAFAVHILTVHEEFASCDLMIDGTVYVNAWADEYNSFTHSSNMVVHWCSAGSQVYVQASGYNGAVIQVRSNIFSSFSGFLLQRQL